MTITPNDCKLCDNCIRRLNVVNGYGNIEADVIFVFDHPRYKQDKTGEFLNDDTIVTFIKILGEFGFDKNNSYFTYLLKCRPISNDNFINGLDVCTVNYLSEEYKYNGNYKKVMVTIGKPASNYILGEGNYRYFYPYRATSIIIPIPAIPFFIKSGKIAVKKLSIINAMLSR